MKRLIIYCLSFLLLISFGGCMENYLDLYPEDKITAANFPEKESDIKLLLDGTYACLRETAVIDQGLFGFGMTDCATPNAYNWGTVEVFNKLGAGRLSSSDGGVVTFRWKRCYEMISRANYLLACLEKIELAGEAKKLYVGEAHFLRGLAYSVLAETYGGVPVVLSEISTSEARNLNKSRKTKRDGCEKRNAFIETKTKCASNLIRKVTAYLQNQSKTPSLYIKINGIQMDF